MKKYIGTKIIQAEPMDEMTFVTEVRNSEGTVKIDKDGKSREGYLVVYPDGYRSWSPKDVFDAAYRELSESEIETING